MKYVSLDIETSCLEPKAQEHILGISMVVEDSNHPEVPLTQLPHFTCVIARERIEGQPYALALNAWIMMEMEAWKKNKPTKYPVYRQLPDGNDPVQWLAGLNGMYPADTWLEKALIFLDKHFGTDRINVAGKNVASFDMQFLPELLKSRFRHRVIDAGSVLVDWNRSALLDLSTLKKNAGLSDVVSHDMKEDALDVIAVLRTTYPKKG